MSSDFLRFGVESRSEVKKGRKLVGYASVFEQGADLRSHIEIIGTTAFKRVLDDPDTDVRALYNHDPKDLLGRQRSGTLRLGTDSTGLEYEIDLPNTQLGRDVEELAERGDLTGASFGFIPDEDEWETRSGGKRIRRHTSVKALVDVSPVTFPAYGGATAVLRSMQFGELVSARSQIIRARHAARYTTRRV